MISDKKIITIALTLFSGLFFGFLFNNVNAISNSMTISPPSQKMILIPGESYSGFVTVSNENGSTSNLDYSVSIGSYSEHGEGDAVDDYGTVDHVNKSSYNQIMDWIVLGKEKGTVAPNESDVIPYTINVPENAPAGGQYAMILVENITGADSGGGGNVNIKSRFQFGSIIYAEVAGETREEGYIKEDSMPSFLTSGLLEATSMVRNDGNVHTDAEYVLQVWPLFSDEEICTNEEEPDKSLILPETERYHAQTCNLPPVGIFRAKQTVKIFGETSIVEKTVIVCPIWLLFIIIFAIFALVFYFVAKAKARKKAAVAQKAEKAEKSA